MGVEGGEGKPVEKESPGLAVVVLLWIVMTPAAVLSAWLAWIVVRFSERLGTLGLDPNSLLVRAAIESGSHAASGLVFVCAAAYVAPSGKRAVSIVFACLSLVFAGVVLLPNIWAEQWWALFGLAFLVAGAVVAAIMVVTDESNVGQVP